jgi:hypothetical protein
LCVYEGGGCVCGVAAMPESAHHQRGRQLPHQEPGGTLQALIEIFLKLEAM